MNELEHAHSILIMAEKDLKALKGMNDIAMFADEIAGFHAQQTIEKSLKAWIDILGGEYPLTHDLSSLLTVLESHGCDVEQFWNLVEYTAFAVQFRYEAFDTDEPLDRAAIITQVDMLFNHVKKILENAGATE